MAGSGTGPWVSVATFCEKVLQEQDGVLSVIRAIDRVIQVIPTSSAGQMLQPQPILLSLAMCLKSGDARGSHTLRLKTQAPSGISTQEQSFSVLFEGEDRGINVVMSPVVIPATQEGLYWFDVWIDEELLTRIPLRVVIQRVG